MIRLAAALAALAALGGCGRGPREVRVGSKKFTESVILGELAVQLVRDAGAPASHRAQLGGTQVLWNALLAGEIDAYPDYTGTLEEDVLRGTARGEEAVRAALAARGVRMSGSLGFDNTYAIGMREAVAERLGIRSISDLARHPELRVGFSEEFMNRADGWPGLRARYGLPQTEVRGLDHDLAYRGLDAGTLDVTDLYATDADIHFYRLRVLEDDRRYFPQYLAVLLWRGDLPARAPAAAAALPRLEGAIDSAAMVDLNSRVKIGRVAEPQVAAEFLERRMGVRSAAVRETWIAALGRNTLAHLGLVAISLVAAILLAIPLGVIAARRPRLGQAVLAAAGVVQTIPSLALLVFLIPLLGIGAPPAVVALFLYSVLPILRNTCAGLDGIPPATRESAEVLGLSPWARLRLVELPMASPAILAGVKTSAVINVGTATIGAVIGAGGYGQPILTGIRLADVSLILQGAVPAALLALLVQALFEAAERLFVPRGLRLKRAA